ncbi:hypothetical protein [Dokdonella immobilis]|uniref:Uncharacterized protein n=1 Tax=Dokdonella immobilis TaxID=578942 RepID=A0A1I4ZUA2_9GAMM|nr:hypothetical protein [Dokdonella immobilis]SFN53811.1 hypothetical protein SAMN05216289_12910 [Dokdonella immobilis]
MSTHIPTAEELGRIIGTIVREAVEPITKRLDAFEQSMEGRGLKFMAKYNRAVRYQKGDMTTFGGSLWVASRETTDAPGAGSDWTRMLTTDRRGLSTED